VESHTNFVYFMTERPVEVFEALLGHGVIARDFGNAPALRLGVGTPQDTATCVAAFQEIVGRLGPI
jgi:histidinol-phosphate/aromatic aminotransferase/cobyric acid decarboxylase-like protein